MILNRGEKGRSLEQRFLDFTIPEPNSGCWIWLGGLNACGYGTIGVKYRSTLAHRLAFTLYVKPIPANTCVLHRCDVPCCVNPDHLFLGTPNDNVQDMEQKKRARHPAGGQHGRAILTEDQVREIRAAKTGRGLAKKYGVPRYLIKYARRPGTWKTVI